MYRDNNQRMGRLFNENGTDDFIIEASQFELVFNTDGANERYRIRSFGSFQWFSSNALGLRSMALGNNTLASGENAFSGGFNTQATGNNAFSFGSNNQSTNFGSVTMGNNNLSSGEYAASFGQSNQSTGNFSFTFGQGNEASGLGSFAFGPQFTQATGAGSVAGGFDVFSTNIGTFAFGENVVVSGAFATGIGQAIQSTGNNAIALGVLNQATGAGSVSIGTRVQANDEGSFTMGYSDTTSGWFLSNNIQKSLMIGFNSDISTFFVGESNGQGTTGNVGIGELAAMGGLPNNKLEIASDANSPTPSGLRFTNLTSADVPVANPGNGVLSVNPDGDVIYVEFTPPPGTGIGNYCPDPQNPLTDEFEVPLGGFNYHFTDPAGPLNQNENNVVIGQDCAAPKPAKLNVYRDITNNIQQLVGNYAINAVNSDVANTNPFTGLTASVYGLSDGDNRQNSGIKGEAVNGLVNIGGEFRSQGVLNTGTGQNFSNYGVLSLATDGSANYAVSGNSFTNNNAQINVGGIFSATGQNTNQNYGVRATASGNGGAGTTNYGIFASVTPGPGTNYAGFFSGDIVVTGQINPPSDVSLKQNVQGVQNALGIIGQLNPVSFEFNQTVYPQMKLADGNQYGFIAQDVETVLPDLVNDEVYPAEYDSLGNVISPQVNFKSMNYQAVIPLLTKGVQEQQSQIDSLENEIASRDSLLDDVNNRLTQLENCLSNILPLLCQINNTAIETNDEQTQENLIKSLNVELYDGENIVLEQNIPNPFAERTVINYYLPESVNDAKLLFYNQQGKVIREIPLNDRGNGRVNVFGAELSNGTYSYTLICDGQVISTKTMVKTY